MVRRMADWFTLVAIFLLLTVAAALVRCWRGPGPVERIMAAQLAGTGVIGVAVVLGAARGDAAFLDAALIGTLFGISTDPLVWDDFSAEAAATGAA